MNNKKKTFPKQFGKKIAGKEYSERPGAYAVIFNERGEVALVEVQNKYYFLPGGGVDGGEAGEDALRREMREETGYDIDVIDEIGSARDYVVSLKQDIYFNKIGNFFLGRLSAYSGGKKEDDHTLVWINPKDAKEKMYQESHWWAIEQALKTLSIKK
jgi:8-oxo-dGTP diphosphatase